MVICELGATTINAVAFSADGQTLFAGNKEGRVLAVVPFAEPIELPIPLRFDDSHNPAVTAVLAHPVENILVVGATTCWKVYDARDPTSLRVLIGINSPTTAINFLDERTIAVGLGSRTGDSSGSFGLWAFDGELRRREPHFAEPKGVQAVAVHQASGVVAWATGNRKLTVWNPRKQDPISIPLKHTSPAIAFHPDGTLIAAAQEWGVKLIDIAKRHEVKTFTGHKGRVTSLAFRPDGRVLATGSWAKTVRLWDVATGQAITSLTAPLGRVMTLAYSPDGLRLAAAGDAGNVVLWDAD
jgi:WD40 repeat protein